MVVTNTVLYIANFNFIRFTKILLRRQVKIFEKVRRKDFLRTNAKYFHGDILCYPSGKKYICTFLAPIFHVFCYFSDWKGPFKLQLFIRTGANSSTTSRCIHGVLFRACNFGTEGHVSEPNTVQPATTRSKSFASSTCPMIFLRGQPTGSGAPIVLNYNHCVALGSGPA